MAKLRDKMDGLEISRKNGLIDIIFEGMIVMQSVVYLK